MLGRREHEERARTVFEGVVLWKVQNVGLLHAEEVLDLWIGVSGWRMYGGR
jgi:hypothetical protein